MSEPNHLFVYGTLKNPRMFARFVSAPAARVDAVLRDHSMVCLQGVPYPAIIAAQGVQVEGVVFMDIPQTAWLRLDHYEGDEYQRVRVQVQTAGAASASLEAWTYVLHRAHHHRALNQPWDEDAFWRAHGDAYLGGEI